MGWFDVAAALVLGSSCVSCERPGRPWCDDCVAELGARVDPHLVAGTSPTIACCGYEGCVPEAIVGFKDRNVGSLGPLLADVLTAGVLSLPARGTLVPVPSTPAAVRRRGFDHTWELAKRVSERTHLPARRLLRSRARRDQAGLSSRQRRSNVEGSMWVPQNGDEAVVVIDDVRTTGATLAESGRVLEGAGYRVVGYVVIASAHG